MLIQDETSQDIDEITSVTLAAFKTVEVSNQTEHFIINQMRKSDALKISLVAKEKGKLLGHIAFSPVKIDGEESDWFALGPISVLPEYQKTGIGSMLISKGLDRLKQINAGGCVLVGSPDYYKRFGFHESDELRYPDVPPEYFLIYSLKDENVRGTVSFHDSYAATS